MDIEIDDRTLLFSGCLDENVTRDQLVSAVTRAVAGRHKDEIRINFSKTERANSIGIRTWIKVLLDLNPRGLYVEAPEWLLDQLSFIPSLSGEHLLVESVILPFYSSFTDNLHSKLCYIGQDIPILESYDDYAIEIEVDGNKYELDCTPDILTFISDNYDTYLQRFGDKKSAS